jgi:periodic tryptophan protein 2
MNVPENTQKTAGVRCAVARYVCLYDVEEKILLRRVQISHNRSLDGVLDQLNSKHVTDAGPAQLLDDADTDEDELLPPTTAGTAAAAPHTPLLPPEPAKALSRIY